MSVKVCQLYKASEKMKAAVYISTEPECYLSGQAKFSASLFSVTTDTFTSSSAKEVCTSPLRLQKKYSIDLKLH